MIAYFTYMYKKNTYFINLPDNFVGQIGVSKITMNGPTEQHEQAQPTGCAGCLVFTCGGKFGDSH